MDSGEPDSPKDYLDLPHPQVGIILSIFLSSALQVPHVSKFQRRLLAQSVCTDLAEPIFERSLIRFALLEKCTNPPSVTRSHDLHPVMAPALRRSKHPRDTNSPSDDANGAALTKRQRSRKTIANTSRNQREESAASRVFSIPELLHSILEFCPTSTIGNALRVNSLWHTAAICFRYRECSDDIFENLSSEDAEFAAATVQTYDWQRSQSALTNFTFPKLERLKVSLSEVLGVNFRNLAALLAITSPLLDSIIFNGYLWTGVQDEDDEQKKAYVEGLRIILEDRKYKIRELRISHPWVRPIFDIAPLLSRKNGWDALKVLEGGFYLNEMHRIVEFGICLTELSVHIDQVDLRLVERLRYLPLQHLSLKKCSKDLESFALQSLHSDTLRNLTFQFESRNFSDAIITNMVQGLPNIQSLQLGVHGSRCSIAAVNAISKHCPLLKDLALPRGQYNFGSLTGHFPLLESLDLRIGRMSTDPRASIRKMATQIRCLLPTLRLFDASAERGFRSRSYDPIPSFLLQTLINDPKAETVNLNILPPHILGTPATLYAIPVSEILSIIEKRKALPKEAHSFRIARDSYCGCCMSDDDYIDESSSQSDF